MVHAHISPYFSFGKSVLQIKFDVASNETQYRNKYGAHTQSGSQGTFTYFLYHIMFEKTVLQI